LAHFWSLGVEEQFYFVWPLVIWLARPRQVPWIAGGLTLLSALVRLLWVLHYNLNLVVPPLSVEMALATVCRMDALFIGALCAWFFHDRERVQKVARWLPLVGILGVGSFFAYITCLLFRPQPILKFFYGAASTVPHDMEDLTRLFLLCGGFTLLAIGFGAIILLTAYNESRTSVMQGILQSRVLGLIGRYSYGIYVYHVPIIGLAGVFLLPELLASATTPSEQSLALCAYMVVIAALSYIVAAISYELFEKKILRLKRHFEPRYAPTAAGIAGPGNESAGKA
jgi:peptidoglycan/LPS O-acetylase OafA/YrhL